MIEGAIIGGCIGIAVALYQNYKKKKQASENLDDNMKDESIEK